MAEKITFIDTREIDIRDIRFEPVGHRFYLGTEDVTATIKRADKLKFPGFDVETDNRRLSNERQTGVVHDSVPPPENDSTLGHFGEQILTNPLGAPLETLDKGVKQILGSFGVKIAIGVGLFALFIWAGGLSLIRGKLAK